MSTFKTRYEDCQYRANCCASRAFFRSCLWTVLLALLILFAGNSVHAWQGKVVRVLDGDTIEVLNYKNQIVRIHLYGVESPTPTQYYGNQAAQYCRQLVTGNVVEVTNICRDFLGRMRSMVWIDDVSLNEEMVRAGFAWVSNPYGLSPSCGKWLGVQQEARMSGLGMWSALDEMLAQGMTPNLPRSCPAVRSNM